MGIELNVSGMTCGHCKTAVESALKKVTGVVGVHVDLAGGKASIEGDHVNTEALIAAVIDEGYSAQLAGA